MKYIFSLPNPVNRFVDIQIDHLNAAQQKTIVLHLPLWRPGRYEVGNFAKNIRGFSVKDDQGKQVAFTKTDKTTWAIEAKGLPVTITYQYYAAQLNAGSCWVDHEQLYINPIQCCMFTDEEMDEQCTVQIQVPAAWQIATGMTPAGNNTFHTKDFHELVDSPFICSPSLQHQHYTVNDIDFHIWFQGQCFPDWERIIKDFRAFTVTQLEIMGSFPAPVFHFLIQAPVQTVYNGVEHLNATVIALGPGYRLMEDDLYTELVGVSSHELFHCWNVKTIRPAAMLPYNYLTENYADTGFVYEGFTTYYGDLILARSGVFSLDQLLKEYSARLQKHMDNPGRFNYSVAASSFDTWLDGYDPGIPGRKVSIYDEGCLLALILDFLIRSASGKHTLDDVMRTLYSDYGAKGIGYDAADIVKISSGFAGRDLTDFFENYVFKAGSLQSILEETLHLVGIAISEKESNNAVESLLGIRMLPGTATIGALAPGSPGSLSGLLRDDEIIAVNRIRVNNNLNELIRNMSTSPLQLTIASAGLIRSVDLKIGSDRFWKKYAFAAIPDATAAQLQFRNSWLFLPS